LSRMRPHARVVLACAAAASLLAGCGSAPDTPDLLSTLPSPVPTVPPPSGAAQPATAHGAQAGTLGATVGAGPDFKPIGGDEFNSGSLNLRKWGLYNSIGGFGYGLRRPSAITQTGGNLVITAAGNTTGGMADNSGQLYGRWEFRARTDYGRGFSSAILLWPDSERLSDGEIDIAEVPYEKRDLVHYILHSGPDGNTLNGWHLPGDYSQWHTFAVDWLPDHITWYVDGAAVYTVTDKSRIPDTPMHLAIQLDEGPVKDWLLAPDATTPPQIHLQVDWVREYALATPAAPKPAAAPRPAPRPAPEAKPAPTTKPAPATTTTTTKAAKPSSTKKPRD
jgi:beta-glucanase (GH16 family)